MSRSYKHTPYAGDKKDKFFKKYANRKLRRKKLIHDLQYNSYKKDLCSWYICDYYWIETKNFEEYYQSQINFWLENKYVRYMKDGPFPIKEECWKEYQKRYIRK